MSESNFSKVKLYPLISYPENKVNCPHTMGLWCFVFFFIVLTLGCEQKSTTEDVRNTVSVPEKTSLGTIVALGDSLTAGYGLEESIAYPAVLEKKLGVNGTPYKVVNAGISGETSSGVLSRINWVISSLQPDVIILVTGANDGMRGIDPGLLYNNLDQLMAILKKKGIHVVLGGMKMLPNLGPAYARAFESVYPQIAEKYQVTYMPFFLQGVAGEKTLNQPDGIHPTAKGYEIIVNNLFPHVLDAIKSY